MLTSRKTHLKFNDYTLPPISINNDTTQDCPLSIILYTFYNAPLVETALYKHESSYGFIDNCLYLAIADTLPETHSAVKDMMERQGSGFTWSTSHNSPFELSKLALMNFPHSHRDVAPLDLILTHTNSDGSITNQSIDTVSTYKYLSVVFDSQLRWSAHHHKVIANATWWSLQIAHLSRISGGMPPWRLRQLYNTVAVPAFTYAADVWFTNIYRPAGRVKCLGSVRVTTKLASIQCRVAKLITGALSTTARDALEAHANLLPVDLLFNKVTFHAAAHIASLPLAHPLSSPSCRAAKRFVKQYCSPLHNLFGLLHIVPHTVETICPTQCRPNYTPAFTTSILPDKPTALIQAVASHNTKISIYCDGLGYKGSIGASAVLYVNSVKKRSLQYHLGPDTEHMVYEAEITGLLLALHLLSLLKSSLCSPVVIRSDSQATIRALLNQKPHPAHHLLDQVHTSAKQLHAMHYKLRHSSTPLLTKQLCEEYTQDVIDLQVHWTPGHVDFPPNECADEIAKSAASCYGTASCLISSHLINTSVWLCYGTAPQPLILSL